MESMNYVTLCLVMGIGGCVSLENDASRGHDGGEAHAQTVTNDAESGLPCFHRFLREFFNDAEFQKNHIRFPVKTVAWDVNEAGDDLFEATSMMDREEWDFRAGPAYFRPTQNEVDILVHDNFERTVRPTGKRVVTFRGVGNGISIAAYFVAEEGSWMLVEWVDLSI